VQAELGVDPVQVRLGPKGLVDLHGLLERLPRLCLVVSLD
jgi:hypothetical protein